MLLKYWVWIDTYSDILAQIAGYCSFFRILYIWSVCVARPRAVKGHGHHFVSMHPS